MARNLTDPSLYINRELSWLEFNARVLREALDSRNPLLERLNFLGIVSSNLDEFYMIRVAGLRRQVGEDEVVDTPDGMTALQQLEEIAEREATFRHLEMTGLHREVLPMLAEAGVELLTIDELSKAEILEATEYFERSVLPVLTPLGIDMRHVVPHISNLALSLAVQLRSPRTGAAHLALMEVPRTMPRWVKLGDAHRYLPLERLIGANLSMVFPGYEIVTWSPFRITRDGEVETPPLEVMDDPLSTMEEQVFRRRFGEVSRLELPSHVKADLREMLLDELCDPSLPPCVTLREKYVHEAESLLQLSDLRQLAGIDIPELRYPKLAQVTPQEFQDSRASVFDTVRQGDVLVHHPFDSFATTVEGFIREAARDENVLAIKLTLYRTSDDSAILEALAEAAERGTQVVVVVELKARFDEQNNVSWARMLENAGVHAVFGFGELKTHAKLALVVRREPDGIRRYVHVGTGNYNGNTARLYTDLGLLTCDAGIGADVSALFNHLTGYAQLGDHHDLLVAPNSMRSRLISLIERETDHAVAGRQARIVAKMNSLSDAETIRALYEASNAGVEIDLIVRGICCLRPGIRGASERIRVMSIVGRFLEHSRVWSFSNGGDEEIYLGSADWMPRNFDRRVEAVVPLKDRSLHPRVHSLLATYLLDKRQAWDLSPDGSYTQRLPDGEEDLRGSHERLLENPWGLPLTSVAESEAMWKSALARPRRMSAEPPLPPGRLRQRARKRTAQRR